MCGIGGVVVQTGERPDSVSLMAMAEALAHRGPDDSRIATYGRAGFTFRRLSIIDVAGGAQPLSNEDGTVHLILNGEIYNHLALRADLEAKGHGFRTRSDAEVVVHGYEVFGDAIVERLRGMFALALWDERRQRLLLARDRLGKKPLVYHEAEGRLAFASELPALLRCATVPREVDLLAIHDYLTYQYVPSPRTAFRGVSKLPPAHRLIFEGGRARLEGYWTLSYEPKHGLDEEDAAREVLARLREAVRVRLTSEVPLGAFLSGGIDSSAVVALMAEVGPVKTFSIGFTERGFDELGYAREVAARYGTDHHEFVVRPQAAELVPKLAERYGEPFADSSALPTYELARVTSGQVTVALTGDGGDELFAGYDRYRFLCLLESWGAFRGLGRHLGRLVPRALANLPRLPARLRRAVLAMGSTPEETYGRLVSYFSPEDKERLYAPEMREATSGVDSFRELYRRFSACEANSLIDRMLRVDTLTYLPDDLLVKVDIASMAWSLECRCPFLDHELVEFAARLPASMKAGGRLGKRVLRRALAGRVPDPVLRRRKMGFGVPIARWFRHELKEMLRDTLLSPAARAHAYLRPAAIEALVKEQESGVRDHSQRLWALLMLEQWLRLVVARSPQRASPPATTASGAR
jgi:asparagine synthase (glutamine-hydrolysing)